MLVPCGSRPSAAVGTSGSAASVRAAGEPGVSSVSKVTPRPCAVGPTHTVADTTSGM